MALGMVLSPMALRAEEAVRPAAPPAAAPGPIVTGYTPPVAECIDPIVQARPLWPELATPGGSGYPDYIDVSENLQVVKSLRLLASIFTRAGQKLEDFTSEEDDEAEGRCLCSLTSVPWKTKKKDCTLANNTCSPAPSGGYPLWFPSDIYRKPSGVFRFVLRQVDFLDKLFSRMGKVAAALQAIGSDIKETAAYLEAFGDHVDRFSDGYHLGGYSTERPALHLCVGYAGHGAFAEMANLFGEVSIGGRYASHNLSKEHRAQFRAGGFGVTAFGRSISIMPGIEAGLQIDGFKMWDAQRPFGIDFPSVGVCPPTDCAECGFPLNRFEDYDIFHLIDTEAELRPLDKSLDGCLQLGEFVVVDRYKARYLSATDGGTYFWPRGPLPSDWEKNNTAVFAAGLNLPLELEQVVKCIPPGIPPNLCPGPGIDLFPGAKLYLKFTLDAGVEWSHRAYGMRKRLQDQVNKKLPTSLQLDEGDFERTMHDFQAPDCSGDDGTTAFVKPRVAGDLFVGIPLGRYLHAGITATIGTGVRVEPGAYGGVVDLNVALADTLRLSNPPREAPCDPVISTDPTTACSNTYFIDSTGVAESTGTYSCDVDDVVTFHCKAPEDDRTCTVANAAEDCPTTGICEASYGCTSHGYCTRTLGPGPDGIPGNADDVTEVTHDTTYASCSGFAVCAAEALNAGAPCEEDSACVAAMQCAGGQNAGQPCNSDPECLEGECEMPKVPCLPTPPVGYFTPYHCATHVNPSITGWEGPGCHPLTVGFASACGCTTDADCVSGQETCVDGACAIGGTPVTCSCDTGLPNSCPAGRVCREGGCVLDCTAHGVADCAAYQVCTGGVCLNPYGIRFAEQIVWHMTHTPKPQHAVSTYALSDILVSLILDASLRIALDLRIFNRLRQFELLDIADYWVIDATLETWYQPGLEVRYQNDCDPVAGNWVTNWQPDPADPSEPRLVTRYNPLNATTGTLGNAGEEDDLLAWCGDTLPTDVADPEGATTNGIIEAVTDLVNWGEDIGMDIWSSNSLCVRQSGPGDPVSTPLAQWLADLKAQSATLTCQYTYQGVPYIFPCAELRNQLLWIWGCLDVNANPWGPLLASAFPGYVTQFSGRQVFNLDLMMDDYRNEFSLDHLDPAIRSYSIGLAFVGVFWYAEVAACFETRFAAMQPGELGLAGVTVEPCCGNGSLDQQGCGLGVSALPCELCDDGNRTAGDGCSPVCRLEDSTPAPRCGDGVRHVGLGEECDDGNQVSGDGCEPDCTLPPEPSPCPGAGLCGLVHDTPACADGACCNVVCGLNPACCLVEWSEACVQLAFELCAPCIGECTSNGYCDNPNCCVNPTDCVCYPPEHPVSVMICGPDCNGNGIADATEPDLDGNGIPDDCECVGGLAGDYDFDGDVDFMDYMVLGGCFAGPAGDLAMGCICADSNGDATVDLRDFATFQAAFGL